MKSPRNKKRGIEVSHWKVTDSDSFQGIDTRNDSDVEPSVYFDPSPELLQEFNNWYKSRSGEALTDDEAKEAIRNMVGLIDVLHKCDMKDKQKKQQEQEG
jgi:hypothetical protein